MDISLFSEYLNLKKEIKEQEEKLEEITILSNNVANAGMPKAKNKVSDPTFDYVAKINEMQLKLKQNIAKLNSMTIDVEATIQGIQSSRDRRIMRMRYINGFTWEKVADVMYFDDKYLQKIHRKILLKLTGDKVDT